ncbi:MAG: class I SAM-dependent methyltransferase [Mariniblastus sp.]|nr:class I SAM-dependent methyltransferase [Mariniblastus sp.]
MKSINRLFRQLSGWRLAKRFVQSRQLKSQSPEQIFSRYYRGNKWSGKESVSGRGSDDDQTATIVEALPRLFAELGISTILDIPCGDFRWMEKVDLSRVEYVGADIVGEMIGRNREQFQSGSVAFQQLDLISDPLPRADLVLCRDCLVHLSFEDVFAALQNLCDSRSDYLLTTTFTAARENSDILTGQWRALNLERAPFHFPPPLQVINEGCSEGGEAFRDKSLGLWALADLRSCFNRQ